MVGLIKSFKKFFFTKLSGRYFSCVGEELGKSEPGQILVVASVDEECLVEDFEIKEMFPIRLAVGPRPPTTQGRKGLLKMATSRWIIPPSEDILEDMTQKMGAFAKDGNFVEEEEIRRLAQSAYRACLEGYLKKESGRGLIIDARRINPSRARIGRRHSTKWWRSRVTREMMQILRLHLWNGYSESGLSK